jgi:hypothetical protein
MTVDLDSSPPDIEAADKPDTVSETLSVIEPRVGRDDLDSDGKVGIVANPYQVYRGKATVSRYFLEDRVEDYVVSVDQSRRLALRADTYPTTETRRFGDLLKLPAEVTTDQCRDMARESIFKWTLRTLSLSSSPDIEVTDPLSVHKLFWIIESDGKELIVDSVDGTERELKA